MVNPNDEKFQKRLLAAFRGEAEEYLATLSNGLLEVEKDPGSPVATSQLEIIYRIVHSLKGASRAVNLTMVESLCVNLENIFLQIKKGQSNLAPDDFDVLYKTIDYLRNAIESTTDAQGSIQEDSTQVELLLQALRRILHPTDIAQLDEKADIHPELPPATDPKQRDFPETVHAPDSVRIQLAKLDALLGQSEGLLSVKLSLQKHQEALTELSHGLEQSKKHLGRQLDLLNKGNKEFRSGSSDQADSGKQHDHDLVEFLHDRHLQISGFERSLQDLTSKFRQDRKVFNASLSAINGEIRKLMMLPFSSVLQPIPRMVRDLARDQDKEIHINISGAELEIDRRILDEIKDPLIHLVRNSIDHGIEKREERQELKKPKEGTVEIRVSRVNHKKIEISVQDDGRGIDPVLVAAKAVKMGFVSQEEIDRRSMKEVLELIFHSGLSTSGLLTEISGRGLGMAIVREKVKKLGGLVMVESELGSHTTIRIQLPYKLGSIRGITIEEHGKRYVVPSGFVNRLIGKPSGELSTMESWPVISFQGENLSLVPLGAMLGTTPNGSDRGNVQYSLLILQQGGRKLALQVDSVGNEQEILVKSFCAPLKHIRYFEGISIMGDGSLIPVLHVPDLFASIDEGWLQNSRLAAFSVNVEKSPAVLVAEDSLTARMLLQNMLESAGYQVKSAKDGVEAYALLMQDSFDLLVSDIEMPGMNGFELTRKIRLNKRMVDLPVILVTALKSKQDREKGLKAGANAYMEKGRFDPREFLEMISTLI